MKISTLEKEIEQKPDTAPHEKNPFSPTDKEVIKQLIARFRPDWSPVARLVQYFDRFAVAA